MTFLLFTHKKTDFEKSKNLLNKNENLEERYYQFYERLSDESLKPLFEIIYQIFFLVATLFWSLIISLWLSMAILFFYLLTSIPIIIYGKKIIPLEKNVHKKNLKYNNKMLDFFSWFDVLDQINFKNKSKKIIKEITLNQLEPSYELNKKSLMIELFQNTINGFIMIISTLVCFFFIRESLISIGDAVVFISVISIIVFSVGDLIYSSIQMKGSLSILKDYAKVKKNKKKKENNSNFIKASKKTCNLYFNWNKNYLVKGKSGIGKTYLAKSITKLIKGDWNVVGSDSSIYITTEENMFFGEIKKILKCFFEKMKYLEIKNMLYKFKIDVNKNAEDLSLGQQQILKILIGLNLKPDFMIFDDVFKNIHINNRKKIIKEVLKRKGLIFVSHNTKDFNVDITYSL